MFIRNMRIRIRASISFGLVGVLVAFVGLFCLEQMSVLRGSTEVIENSWMPNIESLHDAGDSIAIMRMEALRLIAHPDPARVKQSKALIDHVRSELLTRLEDYKKHVVETQEQTLVAQLLESRYARYRRLGVYQETTSA